MSKIKILAVIPARFESTRFRGKPLALIEGKSLIQRTYENIASHTDFDEVVVATDDEKIQSHVLSFGGKCFLTDVSCPTGTDRIFDLLEKEPSLKEYEIVVNVQGDEPLIEKESLEKVIEALKNSKEAVVSTLITKLKKEDALNPSIVKCVVDQKNFALYFSRSFIPGGKSLEYQENGTPYYKHLGIYAYRTSFLKTYATLSSTPLQLAEDLEQLKILEHGYKIATAFVESEALGVDNPEDVQKIETLLKQKKLKSS